MCYHTSMFTFVSHFPIENTFDLFWSNPSPDPCFEFLDDIFQPTPFKSEESKLKSSKTTISTNKYQSTTDFEFLDDIFQPTSINSEDSNQNQSTTGFTICEACPGAKYQIFGFTRQNGSYGPWSSPLYYEKADGNLPKYRSRFITLEDRIRLKETSGLHTYKNQKLRVILPGFKKLIQSYNHVNIILEAKLVWLTNEYERTSLSLSRTKQVTQISNAVDVSHKISGNDYSFEFYLLKLCRNSSKHRCYLHISLRINGIEIVLAKYYVIVHYGSHIPNLNESRHIAAEPLLKTGYFEIFNQLN